MLAIWSVFYRGYIKGMSLEGVVIYRGYLGGFYY